MNKDGIRLSCILCFQAEDGIRDLVRSRGLGDVYKRQMLSSVEAKDPFWSQIKSCNYLQNVLMKRECLERGCLLYTSDAADERSSVDLGGRRII